VAILDSIFGGSSLDAFLTRARKRLAVGRFDEALKAVEAGLARYPGASALVELGHVVRRAQARAGMQALKERVDRDGEPAAYEQLIVLYREVGMPAEALSLAERYARAHPEVASPHVLLGEAALDTFFADLRSRDGRSALDHLLRAGAIDPDALKPRLLLAELYFAIGADRALVGQAKAIQRLAGEDEVLRPVLAAIREAARPTAQESVDACLARVEVAGALVRDLDAWPGGRKRAAVSDHDARRISRAVERLVREGDAEEAVAFDRGGNVVASASERSIEEGSAAKESPLTGVAHTVARTVKQQVRELELGSFRRCVVEGPFGTVVVGDTGRGLAAARGRRGSDPHRLWDRMSVAFEGAGRRS
jgi:tetratricopeptide (TPR) repeat protein